jgi:hypothetical protein
VQDLKTGDFVVIKCGACGHRTEIPSSGLLCGLGLKPTEKVLDLGARLRFRLCDARKAIVFVQWQAAK